MSINFATPDFTHVDTWVFDLDNTLYTADGRVFRQVNERMYGFISAYLKIDEKQAFRLQKLYYHEYGTTLSGMMSVHGMPPKPFLDYVHDIDVSVLEQDADLNSALSQLPGRKVIYTNGTVAHAENVLGQLGIRPQFEEIYDIVAAGYVPKPQRSAFEHILSKASIEASNAAMFEDIARNLEAPCALGMTTVWVRPKSGGMPGDADSAADDELARHPHIHHATDHLAKFLKHIRVTA
jgi:putative hydrolase of the HAD superfamily